MDGKILRGVTKIESEYLRDRDTSKGNVQYAH